MIGSVDINCDMGELFGPDLTNNDTEIMPYISSCNIACGYHSGNPDTIRKTIELATEHDVAIGAHPSYPDRENFGRRSMDMSSSELQTCIKDQLDGFEEILKDYDIALHHIKPHGALYNDMSKNEDICMTVLEFFQQHYPDIKIYGQAASIVEAQCKKLDLNFVSEVFADRRYAAHNRLRSREYDDALITKEESLREHLSLLLSNQVKDVDGNIHSTRTETICIHGDTGQAVSFAKIIHSTLSKNKIEITSHK